MKRKIVVVLSLVAAIVLAFNLGAKRSDQAAVAQDRRGKDFPARKTFEGAIVVDGFRQADATDLLRQRLVELTAKRARHLTAEQLTQAIEELNKTLGQREAEAQRGLESVLEELGRVVRDLKTVSEAFPGTEAGAKASQILKTMGTLPATLNVDRPSDDSDDPFELEINSPDQ